MESTSSELDVMVTWDGQDVMRERGGLGRKLSQMVTELFGGLGEGNGVGVEDNWVEDRDSCSRWNCMIFRPMGLAGTTSALPKGLPGDSRAAHAVGGFAHRRPIVEL